jgi:ribosome-binding factor A
MTKILEDCFKFDHPKGLINAKSKKKVNITFKPTLRFDFDIHLVCIAREKLGKELQATLTKNTKAENIVEKSFIKIHAMGDFPLLRFTDVRNDSVSTANLWERFHLTNLDKELLNPLNESEIEFNNSDKTNQSIHDL